MTLAIDVDLDTADPLVGHRQVIALGGETRLGARAALGTVYQKLGRTEDALEAYGAALARDAAHPVALGNRGELLLRLGRREGFGDVAAAVAADPEGKTAAGRRAARLAKAITADAVARLGLQ